jgi:hypothetical protein
LKHGPVEDMDWPKLHPGQQITGLKASRLEPLKPNSKAPDLNRIEAELEALKLSGEGNQWRGNETEWFSRKLLGSRENRHDFIFFTIFTTFWTSTNFLGCILSNFWIRFWPKILKWTLVLLRIFYFKFDQLVFGKPMKPVPTGFSGFLENQPNFDWNFNPWSWAKGWGGQGWQVAKSCLPMVSEMGESAGADYSWV